MLDRLKQLPLWQWGLFCILGGLFANVLPALTGKPADLSTPEGRGAAAGRAAAGLVFLIVGVVLIVMSFTRKAVRKGKYTRPRRR
jgi:hypothetical protein